MKKLIRREFGDPVLRQKTRELKREEIGSDKIQNLIKNMRHTLIDLKLGVALAAPQVGENLALVVVAVRPMPHRPKIKQLDMVMINPLITEKLGEQKETWEGCISSGKDGKSGLFARVPRYTKVRVKYLDENGKSHHKVFSELQAQIIQHETDHLNGILFVDRVKDTKTYMTHKEYIKRMRG